MFKSEIKAGGNKYRLEYTTGIVITHDKRETGIASQFSGDREDIILLDDKGGEKAFQLVSFDVACREGNKLTIVWAAKKGQELGWYIAVYNHSTSKIHFNHNYMCKMCERSIKKFVFSTIILIFILLIRDSGIVTAFFTSISFGSILGILIGLIRKEKRADKESSRLEKDIEQFMRE